MLATAALFATAANAAEPDAQLLLKNSDQARGGGLQGLVWEIRSQNSGAGTEGQPEQSLRIKVIENASLAEIQEPANARGTRILQVDRNMWISRPGLKKPVAISPRQRLGGQAAIGDIASTNYARDYTAKFVREESVGGEACHVLDLSAAPNRAATYDRITYWVSVKRGVAVQADFLSLSGKKLKSAQFEYGNSITVGGRQALFISKMAIVDALTDARTDMQFSRVRTQALASSEFDVGNLQ